MLIGLGKALAAIMGLLLGEWSEVYKIMPIQPIPRERYGKTGAASIKRKAKKAKNIRARAKK